MSIYDRQISIKRCVSRIHIGVYMNVIMHRSFYCVNDNSCWNPMGQRVRNNYRLMKTDSEWRRTSFEVFVSCRLKIVPFSTGNTDGHRVRVVREIIWSTEHWSRTGVPFKSGRLTVGCVDSVPQIRFIRPGNIRQVNNLLWSAAKS